MTTKEKLLQIIADAVVSYNAPRQAAQDAYNAAQRLLDHEWVDVPYVPIVYPASYDEAHMMNVNVDEKAFGSFFAYVEEFTSGTYPLVGYVLMETTKVVVYFLTFCELENAATERNTLETKIKTEIVFPFLRELQKVKYFEYPTTATWENTVGLFDANCVGITVSFEVTEPIPC